MQPFCGVIGSVEQFRIRFGVEFPVNGHEGIEHRVNLDPPAGQ